MRAVALHGTRPAIEEASVRVHCGAIVARVRCGPCIDEGQLLSCFVVLYLVCHGGGGGWGECRLPCVGSYVAPFFDKSVTWRRFAEGPWFGRLSEREQRDLRRMMETRIGGLPVGPLPRRGNERASRGAARL